MQATDLVQHSTSTECGHVVGNCLDDGSKHVKEDGYENEFDTTEHVCNFGGGGLSNSGNDATDDIDGSQETVVLEGGCGSGL